LEHSPACHVFRLYRAALGSTFVGKTTKNPVFPPMPTLASPQGLSTLFWRQIHFVDQRLAANFRDFINSFSLSFVSSHFLRLNGETGRESGDDWNAQPFLLQRSK
jgi:hypothetical protein